MCSCQDRDREAVGWRVLLCPAMFPFHQRVDVQT